MNEPSVSDGPPPRLGPLDLRQRQLHPEWMDQPGLAPALHADALAGLARANRISFSAAWLWPAVVRCARETEGRTLRMLDIGSGGADVPLALARRARQRGVGLDLTITDISETALDLARERASRQGLAVEGLRLDALGSDWPSERYDVVTSSLFLHHLSEDACVTVLRRMGDAAERLVLVDDLVRSRLGYGLAWAGTRLLTRCRVVQVDGPRSVEAAFSLAEARQLAATAGLEGARVRRRFPERFVLQWWRP